MCDKSTPIGHEHHVIPQAASGTDSPGNLVLLCPDCHNGLHQIELALRHHREGKAKALAEQMFSDVSIRKRMWTLAEKAVVAFVNRSFDPDDEVGVRLTLKRSLHEQIRALAHASPNPNRKHGHDTMEEFILSIVQDYVREKKEKVSISHVGRKM